VTIDDKGADADSPEKWAPGRTLYSVAEMPLRKEDIVEAERLMSITDSDAREKLTAALQSITRLYREQHRDAARPPADWYRTKVGKIQKEAESLLKLLREPQGTALTQLRFRTKQQMGRHLLGSERQEPLSIEQLLDDFVAVCKFCKSYSFPSTRGARGKAPIKAAVASLREVWIEFTGNAFPLNLSTADNRKDRDGRPAAKQKRDDAFISPGPRFVQVMMRIIDPAVGDGAIRTALRDSSVNPESVD
jgi:hypothetical protein